MFTDCDCYNLVAENEVTISEELLSNDLDNLKEPLNDIDESIDENFAKQIGF